MREIKSLEEIEVDELLDTTNLAFSDYIVPFKISKEQLVEKMHSENVCLAYSAGVFEHNNLIGYILNFSKKYDGKLFVYNGGTGVIPTKRGNRLTVKMYDYLIPIFKKDKVDTLLLEVLVNNFPAIKTYEKVGFEISRTLKCFRGTINPKIEKITADIRQLDYCDLELFSSFWDFQPTWQNSREVLQKLKQTNTAIGAFIDDELVGYVIYNPSTKRVNSFAVKKQHRNKLIGKNLFAYISQHFCNTITIINIDENAAPTIKFLENIGLENYVNQYEMKMELNPDSALGKTKPRSCD